MNNVHFSIPEIYGDALSYYELLLELVTAMNEVIENYDTIPDQIAEAVKDLDASQLFSAVLNQLIDTIATDNTKSNNAVKVYKKHDLLYATFNDTVGLYEALIDFTTGTELIVGTNIREVNISELFIELRKLIDDEVQARNIGDTTLQQAINTEKSAREQADTTLQQNITAEASAREQADTTLQQNITAEESAREQADTTLQQNINAETSAREQADTALQTKIDNGTLKYDLLWKNDNITLPFSPQTINIETSKYKLLCIDFKIWGESNQFNTYIADINIPRQAYTAITDYLVYRDFVINDNNISMGGGKWKYTNATEWTDDNKSAIPVRIYGIK